MFKQDWQFRVFSVLKVPTCEILQLISTSYPEKQTYQRVTNWLPQAAGVGGRKALKVHGSLGKISLQNCSFISPKTLSHTGVSLIRMHALIKINSLWMGHTDIIDVLNSN